MDNTAVHGGNGVHTRCISFVVPAWNEEEALESCLTAIRQSARELGIEHEIVVSNDGSTDRTGEIARRLADRTIDVHHRKISATRNSGAAGARGDVLFFVDADTIVNPAVIRGALQAIRNGAVGGGCRVCFDTPVPLLHRPGPWFFHHYQKWSPIAFGCFLFCTRTAYDAAGGFDEQLYIAEEIIMSRRLRKIGTFVIVQEYVVTSGRKLYGHSAWELFLFTCRALLHGPGFLKSPVGKSIWYGPRKPPRQKAKPRVREGRN